MRDQTILSHIYHNALRLLPKLLLLLDAIELSFNMLLMFSCRMVCLKIYLRELNRPKFSLPVSLMR